MASLDWAWACLNPKPNVQKVKLKKGFDCTFNLII